MAIIYIIVNLELEHTLMKLIFKNCNLITCSFRSLSSNLSRETKVVVLSSVALLHSISN